MNAGEFPSRMLAELEAAFYNRGADRRRFLQDREDLLRAILMPVDYLNRRGAIATAGQYAKIVRSVTSTILQHGTPDPRRRFSLYFLKCMQTHLDHHGEDYLQAAKSLSALASSGARSLRQVEAIEATKALEQARRAIHLRAGRKKIAPPQPELFS